MAPSVSQAWVFFMGIGSDELYLDNGLFCVSGLGLLQGGLGLMNCIWTMASSVSQAELYLDNGLISV